MALFPAIGLPERSRYLVGPPQIGMWPIGYTTVMGGLVRILETPEYVAKQRQMTIAELQKLNPAAFLPGGWRLGVELQVFYWPVEAP
jgi:hypothetical protein